MEATRERPGRTQQASVSGSRTVRNEELEKVSQLSEEAHLYVTQGLTCDEQGQGEQAKVLYEKGIRTITSALSINVAESNPHYAVIHSKQEQMRKTKQQIQDRLNHLIQNDPNVARSIDDPPPSYEVATTPTSESEHDFSMNYSLSTDCISMSQAARGTLNANATEIYKIEDGVQIFFITPEGYVSAPSYPSDLRILKFTSPQPQEGASNTETPPAFLKVGDWMYPLFPGCSPALQADWGAYIFPDTSAPQPGSTVGVIIPDTVSSVAKEAFEQTLKDLTAMRTQAAGASGVKVSGDQVVSRQPPPRPAPPRYQVQEPLPKPCGPKEPHPKPCGPQEEERTSTKVAKGIVTAAEWISWGLEKGAEQTEKILRKGSSQIQKSVEPNRTKSQIDPRAQTGAHYVRAGAGAAVKVSKYVVEKLGQATMHLAREAAPHIKETGEKILPQSLVAKKEGSRSKLEDAAEVAIGGLQGFGTVYTALETAAMALGKSIATETVSVVQHKYGDDAGQFTENTLFAAGNIGVAAHNFNHLGVKAIAKRAAKDTGRALVEDYSGTDHSLTDQAGSSGGQGPVVNRTADEDWVMEGDDRMEVDSQGRVVYKNEKTSKK